MAITVDQFVAQRVLPPFRPVVARLRSLMREHAPGATEIVAYGIPAWRAIKILAVLSPTQKDITFAFSRGAEMVDRHGLLRGVGSVSKHVKLRTLEDVNEAALRDYIAQALTLDATTRATRPAKAKVPAKPKRALAKARPKAKAKAKR